MTTFSTTLTTAFALAALAAAPHAKAQVTAVDMAVAAVAYDPSNGDVIVTLNEGVIGFSVVSQLGLLDAAALAADTALGAPSQIGAEAVAFSTTSIVGLPSGTFNLGSLVEAGLTLETLGNFGVSFSGAGTGGFSPVTVVPEPASLALLGLGGLALATRRRRA